MNKKNIITVNDLHPGNWGIIKEITATDKIRQRLMDMGIIEGAKVELIRSAPLGDPIQIKVIGTIIALRRNEARTLIIGHHGEKLHDPKAHCHRHRFGRKSKLR